jgi:hypothetical protein
MNYQLYSNPNQIQRKPILNQVASLGAGPPPPTPPGFLSTSHLMSQTLRSLNPTRIEYDPLKITIVR